MADILRATTRVPGFPDAAEVHLVEASPALREVQARTLVDARHPTWHDSAATLPDLPLFLIANEFFDVLPVRQFLRAGNGWRERVVGVREGALAFGLTDATPVAALAQRLADTAEGDLVELCTPAAALAEDIGRRIARVGGAAIIVDYGSAGSRGDTFQAVRAHERVDPLATPGQADLTAHVDFAALARAAGPGIAARQVPQGVLLERLGITARAQALARGLAGPALDAHIRAHRRLTHPEEMGSLFQALALFAEGTPAPPGFET
jgi:SAM-dependent MidA family methyltransferase